MNLVSLSLIVPKVDRGLSRVAKVHGTSLQKQVGRSTRVPGVDQSPTSDKKTKTCIKSYGSHM